MKAISWLASIGVGVVILNTSVTAAEPETAPPAEPQKPAETVSAAVPDGWSTDLDKALEKAKAEKKCVLVEFTGSDWCPPCIAMRKNVFSKKEFVTGAAKNYILVELDFPRGDKEAAKKDEPEVEFEKSREFQRAKELVEKNQPMAEKYKIKGFPTVVLLDADGKEFSRFVASRFPNVEAFLKHLDEALEKKDLD
jgi:thioredoxin-related protein